MAKKKKNKSIRTHKPKANLNLILWLSFCVFSFILIVFFSLVQNVTLRQRAEQQFEQNTRAAGRELYQLMYEGIFLGNNMLNGILNVVNEYGVSVYLFDRDGNFYFPMMSEDGPEEYDVMMQLVIETIDEIESTNTEGYHYFVELSSYDEYAVAFFKTEGGQDYYCYISSSLQLANDVFGSFGWYSVIIALFAVVLAFVVSGFVSMLITKPVSEVTEKAKELARGNYDVNFEADYYCTEVSDLSHALNYASSEISKADKMQKELIANVSHDFKTPLTMINAYAAMIQEISGNDPEKRNKHTQVIIDEADRLTALVGDLLDLSKMQAGIEQFDMSVFNLSEDVYRVTGRFDYLSETQGYHFETQVDDDLYTFASRSRVEQVLYNLIGNAVNYTGEDKKVIVRLKKEEGGARFEVIDSGKGIPPEQIDTIWERYYRSSESHKRPVQGTGLGLSIVKTILQKQHIDFGVKSEVGKGSCFWVVFPDPPAEPVEEAKKDGQETSS